ncbi:hypothetical protein KC357_g6473 [Hortaea werneckii]|nr:hypothetical protein KC354_g9966 [Hortaea werneckii]KAI7469389.1 hypothetical protein KC357_g6473 [Hortaea werneckii]
MDTEKQGWSLAASKKAGLSQRLPLTRLATICLACTAFVYLNSFTVTWQQSSRQQLSSSLDTDAHFSWENLSSNPQLQYVDCYDGLQCARLEVPMDWWNGTTNATVGLAVIKLPAEVPVTDPRYGGAVLINPGGPGGSGVSLAMSSGSRIQETIGGEKVFDIISFDPRGVGDTTPALQCVESLQYDHSWMVRVMEEGVFEASDASLGRLWSMSTARSKSCALPLPDGEPDIRKYVTTASVARDMLEIVERHGEWREKEAKRVLNPSAGCGMHLRRAAAQVATPPELAYKPGRERLLYWGFSYGTYLGNTFAAMFPDRVQRIVVDGVVDAENYKQTLWSNNLLDTEKDMNEFYHHCARVGYQACALAGTDDAANAEDVSRRVANIMNTLYHNPLPVIGPNPEVITYSDVRNLIFAALYTPIKSFPYVANLLAGIERGDGSEFAKLLKGFHTFQCPAQPGQGYSIIPLHNTTSGRTGMSYDATMGIACTDGDDQAYLNKTAFTDYARDLARLSPSIGSMWSTIRLHCIHYSIRPHYRFQGPWEAKTSHPLLLIGNTMDPVTPVRNAHKMAKGFHGAVALTQDSAGHCSSSTFSRCTRKYIRQYFQTGELPPPGLVCPADEMPFGPGPEEYGMEEGVDAEVVQGRQRNAALMEGLNQAGGLFMRSKLYGGLV